MTWSLRDGWHYGLMGLPLAFVALPLYIVLPNHYAREFGMPLASVGAMLLATRLFDAFIDPALGRCCDRLYARSTGSVLAFAACCALLLGSGFALLFFPPTRDPALLLWWLGLLLVLTYTSFSGLSIAHQSWGAMLGGDEAQRGRIVAGRELFGLAGVLVASVAPSLLGLGPTAALLGAALLAGWLLWRRSPRPVPVPLVTDGAVWRPFAQPVFRRLLLVFMCNGIASALPATLILFFVQDQLRVARTFEPLFLGSYFICAALAIPLWLKLVDRIGLARTWLCGMALSVLAFAFASQLGVADVAGFLIVCAVSGAALGTDLALPGALLAGAIAQAGDRGRLEGAYFGWWNFATKLNLALAAGLALPALAALGYTPGSRDPAALQALVAAYCLVPCALKLLAALLLYRSLLDKSPRLGPAPSDRVHRRGPGQILKP